MKDIEIAGLKNRLKDLIRSLGGRKRGAGAVKKAAKQIGVNHQYIYMMLEGKRRIDNPKILKYFGYEQTVRPKYE